MSHAAHDSAPKHYKCHVGALGATTHHKVDIRPLQQLGDKNKQLLDESEERRNKNESCSGQQGYYTVQ